MRNTRALVISVAAALGLLVVPSAASADFSQGFETDTAGWYADPPASIDRQPSGYTNGGGYADGIDSAGGGWHARMNDGDCTVNCDGPYTDWGDGFGNPIFPAGGYVTSVDVYLDTAWAADHPDRRFDWDSAIDKSDGTFLSDLVFNVGTARSGAPRFDVSASTNAGRSGAFPQNDCPSPSSSPNVCRPHASITESGWYTFRHTFHDDGAGLLRVDMDILDSTGATVASWFIYPGQDGATPTSEAGGNDYGWFANEEVKDLPLDNTRLTSFQQSRKEAVRDSLAAKQSGANAKDAKEIGEAIKHIDKSLDPGNWVDANHLDPKKGNKVFDEEKDAVEHLSKVKSTDVSEEIDELVAIDRQLAQTAIDEIPATANNPKNQNKVDKERAEANKEMAKGDADAGNGKPKDAIDHYKHAWEHAQKATEEAKKA